MDPCIEETEAARLENEIANTRRDRERHSQRDREWERKRRQRQGVWEGFEVKQNFVNAEVVTYMTLIRAISPSIAHRICFPLFHPWSSFFCFRYLFLVFPPFVFNDLTSKQAVPHSIQYILLPAIHPFNLFVPPFTPSFHLYTNPYYQSSIKPQIHQSINSFIQPSIHPPFHTSINLRLCVCVCRCAGVLRIVQRSTRPHTNPSIHLHIHPSATYTLTHAPIHPAIKLFIHPSTAQIYPSTH